MSRAAEQRPGDPTIFHSESPTKPRLEYPTETPIVQPTQRPTDPSELPTGLLTPTTTPTEIHIVASAEPASDPPNEPPTESRTEAESQDTIRDRDDDSTTSETEKPDAKENEASETTQGIVELDGSTAVLESTNTTSSIDERALSIPQAPFHGSEMPMPTAPIALMPNQSVMRPRTQVGEALLLSSANIETTRVSPFVLMEQLPNEGSSRASSNLSLEGSSLASIQDVVAADETAIHSQRSSTQRGPGTLRQPVLLNQSMQGRHPHSHNISLGANGELGNGHEQAPAPRVAPFLSVHLRAIQQRVTAHVPPLRPLVEHHGQEVRRAADEVREGFSRALTRFAWGRAPASSGGQENQRGGSGNQGASLRHGGGQYEPGRNHLSKHCREEKHHG